MKEISFLSKVDLFILNKSKNLNFEISSIKKENKLDEDILNMTIKLEGKIIGNVFQDRVEYHCFEIKERTNEKLIEKNLNLILEEIKKENLNKNNEDLLDIDYILSQMKNNFEFKKEVKNKTVVLAVKSYSYEEFLKTDGTGPVPRIDTFFYKSKLSSNQYHLVKKEFEEEGYIEYEILDKRFI